MWWLVSLVFLFAGPWTLQRFTDLPVWAIVFLTIGLVYLPSYVEPSQYRDGRCWKWAMKHPFWRFIQRYFDAEVVKEQELDQEQQYIFCCFPHGIGSVNHALTMTDCCGFLSDVYDGDRRDLAASILFAIPIFRELVLWFAGVDAGARTANYNLKRGRSLLVFVGGEREQMLTKKGEHKVYVKNRKGFVKLALRHGAQLVPVYTFGENNLFDTSDFLHDWRMWLVAKFRIAITFHWGRWYTGMPYREKLTMVVGKPLDVEKVEEPTQEDIDTLHSKFITALTQLFDDHKAKYAESEDVELEIM